MIKKQADTILRTNEFGDSTGELWYSNEYVKQQIELAFRAGISAGSKIEIHLVQPRDREALADYSKEFWNRINEEYRSEFEKGHVWRVANKYKISDRFK